MKISKISTPLMFFVSVLFSFELQIAIWWWAGCNWSEETSLNISLWIPGCSYNDKLCVFQIYKAGKKPAVDRLCLGIPHGEVREIHAVVTVLLSETFLFITFSLINLLFSQNNLRDTTTAATVTDGLISHYLPVHMWRLSHWIAP